MKRGESEFDGKSANVPHHGISSRKTIKKMLRSLRVNGGQRTKPVSFGILAFWHSKISAKFDLRSHFLVQKRIFHFSSPLQHKNLQHSTQINNACTLYFLFFSCETVAATSWREKGRRNSSSNVPISSFSFPPLSFSFL